MAGHAARREEVVEGACGLVNGRVDVRGDGRTALLMSGWNFFFESQVFCTEACIGANGDHTAIEKSAEYPESVSAPVVSKGGVRPKIFSNAI